MMNAFRIELFDQGWFVPSEPEGDLCAHGHLRLIIGGVEVVGRDESYGISESALAMLRTLSSDHSANAPVADRMIFHGCGNLLMMGCPIGANFAVRHCAGLVRIDDVVRYDTTNEDQAIRFPALAVELPEAQYRGQVVGFARRARELFAGVALAAERGR
jgi:hypothetical protein